MISVRATAPGTYGNRYMERGDVFRIDEKMFSDTWMEKLTVPNLNPKPAEKRVHERTPEFDQLVAKKKGWA